MKKFDDLLRNANIGGKRWKKRNFLLYRGKNMMFEKGGGAKITIILIIYTPVYTGTKYFKIKPFK